MTARFAERGEVLAPRRIRERGVALFWRRPVWLHGALTEGQYRTFSQLEEELYLNAEDGPDLYTALVAHADSGLTARF